MSEAAATVPPADHPGYHEGDPVIDFKHKPEQRERPWQAARMPDDDRLIMVREPKGAFFVAVAEGLTGSDPGEQLAAQREVLDKIFDDDSRAYLQERLDDDEDYFDIDSLGAMVEELQELWGKGRGGSSGGSPRSSGGRSQRSTARRR